MIQNIYDFAENLLWLRIKLQIFMIMVDNKAFFFDFVSMFFEVLLRGQRLNADDWEIILSVLSGSGPVSYSEYHGDLLSIWQFFAFNLRELVDLTDRETTSLSSHFFQASTDQGRHCNFIF